MLDVVSSDPVFPGLETRSLVGGRFECVLDTAQLLLAKLLRSDVLSARGAVDLAVGAVADARAFALAVNALSSRSARVAEHNLELAAPFAGRAPLRFLFRSGRSF